MAFRRSLRRKSSNKAAAGPPGAATVAYYGLNASFASKVVVALHGPGKHMEMRKWFSQSADVRHGPEINAEILEFLQVLGEPRDVVVTDGIIGCPHEEGVDYMEGVHCPLCPFWKGRDRFTHEMIS
ncbi:MAG: hypothetical protein FJW31_12190 [Acidobacteria bacterium]|nr:hypothetical protein [Acidobacteriota bacterium]